MIAADQGPDRRTSALRHFFEIETVRIAARDVLDLSGLRETGRALADLGAAVVAAALHAVAPGVPMAVVAMGSFGGAEIAYGSDLDVLLVYEGTSAADVKAAERAALGALSAVQRGDAGRGDRPDRRLAPPRGQARARSPGASTPSRSTTGAGAQTWERQALLRARPVAGSTGGRRALRGPRRRGRLVLAARRERPSARSGG